MLLSKRLFGPIEKMKVRGMLLLSSLTFALIFSFLAIKVGLAAIVGAFAAGLVLAKTNQVNTIEARLKPVADVFTPIFFIMVGAAVDISGIAASDITNAENPTWGEYAASDLTSGYIALMRYHKGKAISLAEAGVTFQRERHLFGR